MCSVHKQKPLMTYFTDYARTMVVLRLSFFSSFLLFIWTSWLWKFLGQHSRGLGLYSFLLFFSLFFFLFLFSRKAVQVFFLLCESPVILKTLTLIRKFLPFHTQTVQTSFFFFYVLVEPHMFKMREVSVFCFCPDDFNDSMFLVHAGSLVLLSHDVPKHHEFFKLRDSPTTHQKHRYTSC